MLSPFLSLSFGLGAQELGVIIIIFSMLIGCIMGVTAIYFKFQRRQMWHETARIALEKGQPIPDLGPAPRTTAEAKEHVREQFERHRAKHGGNDLRAGLIMLGISLGMFAGLGLVDRGTHFLVLAFVPGGIGLALLVNAVISAIAGRKFRDDDSPAARP